MGPGLLSRPDAALRLLGMSVQVGAGGTDQVTHQLVVSAARHNESSLLADTLNHVQLCAVPGCAKDPPTRDTCAFCFIGQRKSWGHSSPQSEDTPPACPVPEAESRKYLPETLMTRH